MKQFITLLKQVCILLLFVGLAACGGGEREALKAEVEQTLAEIGDEMAALKAVEMEHESVVDGLKDDLKWEYSEELEKLVSQYESEFSMLKENIGQLDGIYDAMVGYQDKLGGAPLEYSFSLTKEMFEESLEHFKDIVKENEAIQEKFYDLSDQLDQLGETDSPEMTGVESNLPETTDSVE